MSEPQTSGYAGNPSGRFLGGLLMAIGGLMAGLCGLCSVAVLAMMGSSPGDSGAVAMGLLMVAVVGGGPLAVGAVIFIVGRNLHRSSKPRPDPNTFA